MKAVPVNPNKPIYGQTWQLWLDGPSDLVKVWDMPPHSFDLHQRDNQRNALERRPHFFGVNSEPEAREVLAKGWPQGAAMVEALAARVQETLPPPKSRRRVRKWREDGDELNIDRYRLGYDTPWRSMHRKLKSACGLVEVICSWGESCGATVEQLQWSGAAALALTDLLEKADYSVELALVAAMGGYHTVGTSLVRVDLKRMGELVNLESLASVAVYPPAWRLYGLCAFQQSPFGSGDDYNSHPHARAWQCHPDGMWDYRPNVMTLVLHESHNEQAAHANVLEALKCLESLVNPQEIEQ